MTPTFVSVQLVSNHDDSFFYRMHTKQGRREVVAVGFTATGDVWLLYQQPWNDNYLVWEKRDNVEVANGT